MAEIHEMATSLGQALGRTPEYQALDRAMKRADEDREIVELRNEIQNLERELQGALAQGNQPTEEQVQEYEGTVRRLQASASYQNLVAAQANFEKVMVRVNDAIQKGMQEGASSRIIIPS